MSSTTILERRLGTLLPATKTWTKIVSRPSQAQTRTVAVVPGPGNKDPNNMGGPGGQEHYPESAGLRRKYAMNTVYGVLAACSAMVAVKMARWNARAPKAEYVLIHDSSKGELDDVRFVRASDLAKMKKA